ncbi:MAG: hypothetical protein AAB649_02200 [Patescibacteria group bacterium]
MKQEERAIISKFAELLIGDVSNLFNATQVSEIVGDSPGKEIFFQGRVRFGLR